MRGGPPAAPRPNGCAWALPTHHLTTRLITDNIVFATIVTVGSQVAEKMPLLLGVGFLGGSLYVGYSFRTKIAATLSSALKKLLRFGR